MRLSTLIGLLVPLACAACSGSGTDTDAALDTHPDDALDATDTTHDPHLDDAGDDCVDEADPALGDRPFPTSECSTDPAVAVIEVTLTTLGIGGWVGTAPEGELTLTEGEMIDLLREELIARECVHPDGWWVSSSEVIETGPFAWLDIPRSDFGAGALFDTRTGEMVLTLETDWLAYDVRCTPMDPLEELSPSFAAAGEPSACHAAFGTCAGEIDELNYWGAISARGCGGCGFDRTYEEVWERVRHTSLASAFHACGDYEMFVRGMTTPGGYYCMDLEANRMVFVLAGRVDTSVLP